MYELSVNVCVSACAYVYERVYVSVLSVCECVRVSVCVSVGVCVSVCV